MINHPWSPVVGKCTVYLHEFGCYVTRSYTICVLSTAARSWVGRGVLVPAEYETDFSDGQLVKNRDRDADDYPLEQYDGDIKGDSPDGRKPLAEGGGGVQSQSAKEKGDVAPPVGGIKRGEREKEEGEKEEGEREKGEGEGEGEKGEGEGEKGEGEGGVEEDREGAEQPVEDDSAIFISQLTEAGVRKRERGGAC